MLIETVAKRPFSFQVVPFDCPRNHITIYVRIIISLYIFICNLLLLLLLLLLAARRFVIRIVRNGC